MPNMISSPMYMRHYVGNIVQVVDLFAKKQKYLPPDEWVMFKDEPGEIVPSLVPEELWVAANTVLKKHSEDVKNRQGIYLLIRNLYCACCGTVYYRRDTVDQHGSKNSKWGCSGITNTYAPFPA